MQNTWFFATSGWMDVNRIWQPGKKVQLKLDVLVQTPSPHPADEPQAVQLNSESSPPEWAWSPTVADDALVVQCSKKPAKRRCKASRLALPIRRTCTPAEKLAWLDYSDTQLSQCLSLCRAEHASQQAVSQSFGDHVPSCLYVLLHVTGPLCSPGHFGYIPPYPRGGGGYRQGEGTYK